MVRRKSRSSRKKRSGAKSFLLLILLVVLGAGGVVWLVFTPFGPESETFVDILPGSSTTAMGRQLEEAGVVRSQFAFDVMRLWKRGTLRAGEYRFDHPAPVTEVYARIERGDVYTRTLVVPEGANIFEIAARVEAAGFCPRQEFLDAAAQQTELVTDLDPRATSLEGYLFPDTYRFDRRTAPAAMVAAMVRRFRTVAGQLGLNGNVHEIVTIASLVEKETAVDADRPLVASVFENRLKKRMPLMTDPAVIYGLVLENRWRGTLFQSDLTRDTAYNTYLHNGLPPGPVASPGVRSLRAAMQPAATDYLYFVAAGTDAQGKSLFAATLDEHNRDVARYRHAMKKAGGQ